MSQNGPYSGPPWPGGTPDEPYSEPSDPWSEPASSWQTPPAAIPQQQRPAPAWNPPPPPPPPPPRRNFPTMVLVAVLAVLAGGGLATTAWLLLGREESPQPTTDASTAPPAYPGPRPQTSEDARFVAKGQCVRNEGTNKEPQLRVVVCAANTYEVLKRIDGRTTGEKDAIGKCANVTGYTEWYYYDTEYDDIDFVLCLREYKRI